jgi:hypothetical protein
MGNFSASLTRIPFHVILLWGNQSKFLWILIDSGADESFLDAILASELNIPTQPLSIPVDVRELHGRSIGRVTHTWNPKRFYLHPKAFFKGYSYVDSQRTL